MSSDEDDELAQLRAQRQARTGMPSLVRFLAVLSCGDCFIWPKFYDAIKEIPLSKC